MSINPAQFLPIQCVSVLLRPAWSCRCGPPFLPFPGPWPSPPYATGVCAFTSPTCRGLFCLPSRKVHANRTRCYSPCFLRRLPITTALWVVVFLRFIALVLTFGCRTEDQFHS